ALLRHATESGHVPGVVAMATSREGTLYEGAFGLRALGSAAPMALDSVVWIASMTKALTTTAALQLVEQGKLELDAPASEVAPQLAQARVLTGFDAAGQPVTRPPKRPITLRHLLTHTSGFGHETWSAEVQRAQAAWGLPRIGSGRKAALRVPLLFDPGERWQYGIGIDWAGQLIEAASGRTLGAYLHEHVLAPLRMQSTAFRLTPPLRSRLAGIHQRDPDGTLKLIAFETVQEPEFELGGGGLYSTASDYLRFVRAVLNGGTLEGQRILRGATVRDMAHNQIGALRVRPMATALPALSNDAEFLPGIEKTWGLGFQINENGTPTGRPAGGLMWAGLPNTFYWIDALGGVGGVLLTQILPFADTKAVALFGAFESAVYESLS
ncbi:MAG: serine hydrolase domain-containing protein, partial [Burkholderiaceae bacterium]